MRQTFGLQLEKWKVKRRKKEYKCKKYGSMDITKDETLTKKEFKTTTTTPTAMTTTTKESIRKTKKRRKKYVNQVAMHSFLGNLYKANACDML